MSAPSLNTNFIDNHLNKMKSSPLLEKSFQKNPRRVQLAQKDRREPLLMHIDKSSSANMETTNNPLSSEDDAYDHEGDSVMSASVAVQQVEAREGCINPVSLILWETDEDANMGEDTTDCASPSFRVVSPAKGSSLPNLSIARPMPVRPILLA